MKIKDVAGREFEFQQQTRSIVGKVVATLKPGQCGEMMKHGKAIAEAIMKDIPGIKLKELKALQYEEYDNGDITKKWRTDKLIFTWTYRGGKPFFCGCSFENIYKSHDEAYGQMMGRIHQFLRSNNLQQPDG